jgi:3-hydroxyacyl-[acyl-carrier-protein] dehydratase
MSEAALDIDAIIKLLPHRAPFLLVEKITDIVPFESGTGWKAVSYNEPHFAGHFPDYPVMPGVLLVEAMAQTSGAIVQHSLGMGAGSKVFFMTIENARFRKPVRPGDLLRMPVKALRRRGPVFKFEGKVYVGDDLCAEAEFSAMIHDGSEKTA